MKQKILKKKKALITFITLILIITAVLIAEEIIEPMGYIRPDYEKTDIA